jgi:uncharacterized protein YjiS (DUF1127 family)
MPAITAITISVTGSALRALAMFGSATARHVKRLVQALKNRRIANRLTGLDDRMLADIGLTRFDLRDAYAEALWRDPTDVLARRADERRFSRHRIAFERSAAKPGCGPCPPSLDRPAQYLM